LCKNAGLADSTRHMHLPLSVTHILGNDQIAPARALKDDGKIIFLHPPLLRATRYKGLTITRPHLIRVAAARLKCSTGERKPPPSETRKMPFEYLSPVYGSQGAMEGMKCNSLKTI
jgi:hypothetical protein